MSGGQPFSIWLRNAVQILPAALTARSAASFLTAYTQAGWRSTTTSLDEDSGMTIRDWSPFLWLQAAPSCTQGDTYMG